MAEITLFMWPGADGLPSSSPYCLKILYALRYKGLPHRIEYGAPAWSTTGKLPAAEVGGQRLEDSSVILGALERLEADSPRLYPADPAARAEATMLEDWSDDSFTLNLVYYRWTSDANFARLAPQAFGMVPAEKRDRVAADARAYHRELFADRGIAQYSESDRIARFSDGLLLLEQRLGRAPFLVGEQPSVADFAVFPTLQVMRAAGLSELVPSIERHPDLLRWLARMSSIQAR